MRKLTEFTKEEVNTIVKMYSEDYISMSQIGKNFDTNAKIIKEVLTRNNIEVDSKGKRKNKYIIEGNIVKIELRQRNKENLWTIIDLEDLDRVINYRYSWHVHYDEKTGENYATATNCEKQYPQPSSKRLYTISLHKFIMGIEGITNQEFAVDHENHNTLDNRKENLRVIKKHENDRHRKGKNSNNKTGYRNVAYIKSDKNNPYYVQLMVNGKNTCLGKFSDVDEAGKFAEEMREKYYGKFKGDS